MKDFVREQEEYWYPKIFKKKIDYLDVFNKIIENEDFDFRKYLKLKKNKKINSKSFLKN